MEIVKIDSRYINYLSQFDKRVCYNKDFGFTRPYIGILFKLKGFKYFAPLTSSSKGEKLINKPKKENLTFFPIDNCQYGGVNVNNMIPVIDGVYTTVNYTISPTDSKNQQLYKIIILNQKEFLNKEQNSKNLRTKANRLYSMKTTGYLKSNFSNYDLITCDFKLLEEKSKLYK